MADRFFHPDSPRDGRIVLDGDEAKHLARVARRREGDVVEIFDGRGGGFHARIEAINRNHVDLSVLEPVGDRVLAIELTLAVPFPKGDRTDWLIEKATELGVSRLVPLLTDRSVVDPRAAKIDRLRRGIVEASKQCGRNRLMTLDTPQRLSEYLGRENARGRLFAHSGGHPGNLWPSIETGQNVALAVGPEGG